jgi:hypothetical protein
MNIAHKFHYDHQNYDISETPTSYLTRQTDSQIMQHQSCFSIS